MPACSDLARLCLTPRNFAPVRCSRKFFGRFCNKAQNKSKQTAQTRISSRTSKVSRVLQAVGQWLNYAHRSVSASYPLASLRVSPPRANREVSGPPLDTASRAQPRRQCGACQFEPEQLEPKRLRKPNFLTKRAVAWAKPCSD